MTSSFFDCRYGDSDLLKVHFDQRCTEVDLDNRCVTFRKDRAVKGTSGRPSTDLDGPSVHLPSGHEEGFHTKLPYDLLVGADGARSVVRTGMMKHLRRCVNTALAAS
jgi:2-polyprenyl-6-methoxyphenol hydroxylase-like FAD-dependent oxidoreductase